MKKIFILLLIAATTVQGYAQNSGEGDKGTPVSRQHRIIFQLTTDDSLSHKALMKQLNNITSVAPATKIEVVCHGPGLNMLLTGKSTVYDKIQSIIKKDVRFLACEFSMKERKVSKDQVIPEAGYVEAGIIAIVIRQEEGWSYIKSGF